MHTKCTLFQASRAHFAHLLCTFRCCKFSTLAHPVPDSARAHPVPDSLPVLLCKVCAASAYVTATCAALLSGCCPCSRVQAAARCDSAVTKEVRQCQCSCHAGIKAVIALGQGTRAAEPALSRSWSLFYSPNAQ
jgi:hypothetical protein